MVGVCLHILEENMVGICLHILDHLGVSFQKLQEHLARKQSVGGKGDHREQGNPQEQGNHQQQEHHQEH